MELIDSHCHLPKSIIKSKEWVENAKDVGVIKLINIGTSIKRSKQAIKMSSEFDNVFNTVAVYPNHEMDLGLPDIRKDLEALLDEKEKNKIVGIGECGFDITNWSEQRSEESQIELFNLHLELADKYKLPIILHNRNGEKHFLDVLNNHKEKQIRGVAHCFSQDIDFANTLIDLNFYISFSALITYPQNEALREVVKQVPLDKILVETDAPFLVPEHLRGLGPNEPKNVLEVAKKIAEIREIDLDEVASQTTKNAVDLFGI